MEAIAALLALTLMEIVLGIDNIIFITILTDRLPVNQQPLARQLGLFLAMLSRIMLLFLITMIIHLTTPLFTLTALGVSVELLQQMGGEQWTDMNKVSGRDITLLLGGLFLIRHSVKEIHEQFEGVSDEAVPVTSHTFTGVLINITIMDIVFSLDSVITAVGMTEDRTVMITAVVFSVMVMMVFAERISRFVKENPTFKMLALSFLILIGVMLVAEAAGTHVNKGYIYFAMAFSLIVEALNLRVRKSTASAATDATTDGAS
ncbi:MAG: TerC family protein [Fuerstiella sp.]|nr:TerC family protein [Fuerstiella sp.]MCP4509130.1 TerC family protein [Fuerstiella sp.]